METCTKSILATHLSSSPYSLGKSVEWKRVRAVGVVLVEILGPYSLGKSVEWKLKSLDMGDDLLTNPSPYSLGKSVEWKPFFKV